MDPKSRVMMATFMHAKCLQNNIKVAITLDLGPQNIKKKRLSGMDQEIVISNSRITKRFHRSNCREFWNNLAVTKIILLSL